MTSDKIITVRNWWYCLFFLHAIVMFIFYFNVFNQINYWELRYNKPYIIEVYTTLVLLLFACATPIIISYITVFKKRKQFNSIVKVLYLFLVYISIPFFLVFLFQTFVWGFGESRMERMAEGFVPILLLVYPLPLIIQYVIIGTPYNKTKADKEIHNSSLKQERSKLKSMVDSGIIDNKVLESKIKLMKYNKAKKIVHNSSEFKQLEELVNDGIISKTELSTKLEILINKEIRNL